MKTHLYIPIFLLSYSLYIISSYIISSDDSLDSTSFLEQQEEKYENKHRYALEIQNYQAKLNIPIIEIPILLQWRHAILTQELSNLQNQYLDQISQEIDEIRQQIAPYLAAKKKKENNSVLWTVDLKRAWQKFTQKLTDLFVM